MRKMRYMLSVLLVVSLFVGIIPAASQKAYAEGEQEDESNEHSSGLSSILAGMEETLREGRILEATGRDYFREQEEKYGKTETNGYEYILLKDGTAEITDYTGSSANLEIPSMIERNPVSKIDDRVFWSCKSLKTVIIPEGVTSIGDYAFSGCSNLEKITLPDSLKSIGKLAFQACSSLKTLTLPEGVRDLGAGAFYKCSNLEKIVIQGNTPLVSYDSTWVEFEECKHLKEFHVDDKNPAYTSIDGILYNKEMTELILAPNGVSGHIIIPDAVTKIGDYAFCNCKNLERITAPEGVTSIGAYAFFGCECLEGAQIPASVTYIGEKAFSSSGLKEIAIPDGVVFLNGVVSECSSLEKIIIPDSLNCIGDADFYGCSSLKEITIPNSVRSIGQYSFQECSSLEKITIPDSVEYIGVYAFEKCSSLKEITIPNSVMYIGGCAFEDCSNLETVTLSENLDCINDAVFQGCSCLKKVIMPDSLLQINDVAFYSCSSLETITIPESVRCIYPYAFYGCDDLTITLQLGSYAEEYCRDYELKYQYEPADGRSEYIIREEGDYEYRQLPDGTAEITNYSGENAKLSIPETIGGFPVSALGGDSFSNCGQEEVIIPDSVTYIGDYAFFNNRLETITIPENVTFLGEAAFYECSDLKKAVIQGCIDTIRVSTFRGCNSLETITIPESLKVIEGDAFSCCGNLKTVNLPNGLISIEVDAFYDCEQVNRLTIPESVLSIYPYGIDAGFLAVGQGSYAEQHCKSGFTKRKPPKRAAIKQRDSIFWETVFMRQHMPWPEHLNMCTAGLLTAYTS